MQYTFLICSERSGSNLITKIMDAHPDYCGPPPSHIIRALALNILRYPDVSDEQQWQALTDDAGDLLTYHVGAWKTQWDGSRLREEVKERSQAALIQHVYRAETLVNGKKNVFIKENHAHRFVPFLLQYFPDSKFIWMTRDPRDMALSWKKNNVIQSGVKNAAHTWQDDQKQSLLIYGYLKHSKKILRLSYENLLISPEQSCRRICEHLHIPFAPSMLNFYEKQETKQAAGETEAWNNLEKPLLTDNFAKYRGKLSEQEIRYVEAVCAEEMQALNYPLDYPLGDIASLEACLSDDTAPAERNIVPEPERTLRENRHKTIARILARPLEIK
jgi:hypothetical protein